MNINGNSIFMGAYAERRQQEAQFNPKALNVSDDRQTEITGKLKEAMQGIDRVNSQSAKVSISQEDMDFLCSEAGFEKMKKDAEELYLKNVQTQKTIAAGREESDVFWNNTGNQWMIFSEYLYNNDFYTDMTDEEVQEMEKTLAQITAGMDHLSRSQYTTGIEFSDYYGHGANYFMSSGEVLLELESSTSALRFFADKYVSEDKKEQFEELIDQYHSHNTEIIGEYVNPMESFSKMVHGIHSGKYPGSSVLNMSGEKKVDEYKYTVMSGGISKTEAEKAAFQKELASMFDAIGKGEPLLDAFWEQLKDKYVSYVSDDSEDESFRDYIWDNSTHTVNRIQNYWNDLVSPKVKISEEDNGSYRERITNNQSFEEVQAQRKSLLEGNLSPDMNYKLTLSARVNSLNEADKEAGGTKYLSNEEKLDNIMEAYTSLYDEIVQGYENGTRVINVADENSENGYRPPTMQEELDDLDRAYESVVNTTVSIMEQSEKVSMAFDKYYAKIQSIGAGRAELANAYADRRDKVEMMPENAVEKMISERDAWKVVYAKSFSILLK